MLDIERVIVAFSRDRHDETLELIRELGDMDVQIDVVPRLFEVIGPSITVHTLEGLPLVGLPPIRISRSSQLIKRTFDLLGALVLLLIMAPVFAVIAVLVKRDSPGPVFFRQRRVGMNQKEFMIYKFRTMKVDTDDAPHRDFIKATMSKLAAPTENGLYKLERKEAITAVGRWLRR